MALHFDPIYNLVWLDQPGKSLPELETLWRFPLPGHPDPQKATVAVREAVGAVWALRPVLAKLRDAENWGQLRDLLAPVIQRAIASARAGA